MDDESFGELLVQQGVSSRERIRECVALRNRMAEAGVSPLPSLVDLLAQKGYISSATQEATMKFEATLRASARPAHSGPAVGGPAMPPEAVQAAGDPANLAGKYIRVKRVGVGGMGEVWRAWDKALGRWVALKVMKYDDPGELERFRREAQTAAKLSHPNIGAIYEAQDAWIAMQFVNGQNLATFPRDDQRQLVGLIRDAALALQHAHEKDVIHRDLKPHNLMVEGSGKSWRLYVMDFGLAKQAKAESSLSAAGSVLGTPAYMPPEQARGRIHEVDARSDVYSLGATLYELLCSRTPFVSKDVYDLLKRVIEDDPQPLRQVNRRIDEDLETIVMKCLEKDPARRYGTMQELAEELNRWLAGEAILAHPPSAAYRLRKFLGRRKGLVAAVASTSVLALAAWLVLGAVSRGREFDRLKTEAETAFAERRWGDAKTAGARALELREAPALSTLVADAAGRAKAEETEKQRRIKEGDQYKKVQEKIRPVQALIQETRPFFYIEGADIRAKLDKVELALKEVEALTADAANRKFAELWVLLGMGRYFVGDQKAAEKAFAQVEPLAPNDGRMNFYLAMIYLERAIKESFRPSLSKEERLQRRQVWNEKALERLKRPVADWVGAEEIDHAVAKAYEAYARGDDSAVRSLCDQGLAKFGTSPGTEDFELLLSYVRHFTQDRKGSDEALDQALRRRPHHAFALYLRATQRAIEGDHAGSLEDLNRALRVNAREAAIWSQRARINETFGKEAEALADNTRAVELDPEDPLSWTNRATLYVHLKKWEPALADLEKAISIDSKNATVYAIRATYWIDRRDLAKAMSDCDKAIELNPRDDKGWTSRAQVHFFRRDDAAALSDISTALDLDRNSAAALTARSRIRLRAGDASGAIEDLTAAMRLEGPSAATLFWRGQARWRAKELEGALKDLQEALRLNPRDRASALVRAEILEEKGESQAMAVEADRILKEDPNYWQAYQARASSRWKRKDWDAALADLEKALGLQPEEPQLYVARAHVRSNKNDYPGAIRDLTRAIELDDRKSDAYLRRAELLAVSGQPEKALADWARGLELDPKDAPAHVSRGYFRSRRGELKEALADFSRAIELGHRAAAVYSLRGLIRFKLGEGEAPLPDFEEALRLDPNDAAGHEGRGAIRQGKGDLDGALEDYEALIRVKPTHPSGPLYRGKIRLTQGNLDGAIADLTRAIELSPKEADAWASRGSARWQKKDEEGGVADMRKAIELSKDDPEFRKPIEDFINKVRPPKK